MTEQRSQWSATIGWIKPGAVDKSIQDAFAMTPPDVNLSILTTTMALKMMNERFDAGAVADKRADMLDSVRQLMRYSHPDFVALTGDLIQSAMGRRWDGELRNAIQEAAGVPATTAMTAVTDALAHLGARKIALASPFRDDQNGQMKRYLEDAGFEVTAMGGYQTNSIKAVKELPDGAPLEIGKRVFAEGQGADVLYLPCPIWRVTPYIDALEQACGVPVITMLNAFIWKGLHTLGHPGNLRGYGQVLERVA